jgi:hypothetical protein
MKFFSKEWREEKWKDPVYSKIIASYIDRAILTLWALIGAGAVVAWKFFPIWFSNAKAVSNYPVEIPVWGFIAGGTVIWLFRMLYRYLKSIRRKPVPRNPVLDTEIGNYTFESLLNILKSEKLRTQTERMVIEHVAPPDTVLLAQFIKHYEKFKVGIGNGDKLVLRAMGHVNTGDGGYLTDVLAPKLLGYGLLEANTSEHTVPGYGTKLFTMTRYKISDLGYKFFDCLAIISPKYEQVIFNMNMED